MKSQAQFPEKISGQVPNQSGSQLPGLIQLNGNALHQMPNLGVFPNMDAEFLRARSLTLERICNKLLLKYQHPVTEAHKRKVKDLAKRLEEGLLKAAISKEDYMNLDTLDSRLSNFLRMSSMTTNHHQHPQLVSSSPIATMIPTPGMSHITNSTMITASSVDTSMIAASGSNSIASPSVNSVNMLPAGGMLGSTLNRSDGLSNGYKHSATSFSIGSGGNMSSVGVQRVTSQMIPTPGFSVSNNHSYTNMDPSSNNSSFSGVDSTLLLPSQSQPQRHQKLQDSDHNNHALHNLGSQIDGGRRSDLLQNTFAYPNGSINSGLGLIGNSIQIANELGTEDYTSAYSNSPKNLQQLFDQNQQPVVQGDKYGLINVDTFNSGSFYASATSSGSMLNTQNMNAVKLPSIPISSSLISGHSNLPSMNHTAHHNSQAISSFKNLKFQSSLTPRNDRLNTQHQYEQRTQQCHQSDWYAPQQFQLNQQSQQPQHLVNNDAFPQSQLSSGLDNNIKSEPGVEPHKEILTSQLSEQFHTSEMHNHFQQIPSKDCSKVAQQQVSLDQHNSSSSPPQISQQMLHPYQLVSESQNNFNCLSVGSQSKSILKNQWPRSQDENDVPKGMLHEQHLPIDFHQRIPRQDETQCCNLPLDGSIIGQAVASKENEHRNQQKWLLFLFHARCCSAPEGQCQERHCSIMQKLCNHVDRCIISHCPYPRCGRTRKLLHHYIKCRNPHCPVCILVRKYRHAFQLKSRVQSDIEPCLPVALNVSSETFNSVGLSSRLISKSQLVVEISEDLPAPKRMKTEQYTQSTNPEYDSAASSALPNCELRDSKDTQCQSYSCGDMSVSIKSELKEVKAEVLAHSMHENLSETRMEEDNAHDKRPTAKPVTYNEPANIARLENIRTEKESGQDKQENVTPSEPGAATKSGKPKIKGVSLTELFTPEQVREHITGLRQWVGQSKSKAKKNQAMEHSMSENSCQLCAVEKLTFEPPPIYCTTCGVRIKRNNMYYTMGTGDTRHYFCIPCYNEPRGDTIVVDGTSFPKSRLEKKKNDEETEEWWVQCDKCEAWQHQICALFNGRRNDGGQAEYTCPNCYIQEVERGERKPLPQNAVLGAKDLPRTILSDQIEQRLFRRLKLERQERARLQGKNYDEVPGAESLVIRVVSSVDKKLEVKQRFLEIFQEENYPTEFPYKSKVVLLFQKIEGVEVCLFGMYVQEFGSESKFPNQRRVYLSYLDSVKYFRPEVKAVTGEALRTFVYHEILIGYLEYCKKRGFTSCYIWACPPLKGEDYILYCHPEIQKTPKSDKLREWYLAMLRKAAKENIVVDLTNLYDHFFVSSGECRAKVTAARLPYFDGDYWPGAAEDLIHQLRQEEDGRKQNKKGTTKKTITKRALKASGQSDLSGNATKDLLLMHKLGETISPMKEDFIMVHLQHACSHCCILMVSGNRWVCRQCKNFQICDKCYEAELKREERERHPINQREKHILYPVEIIDVPADTKDKDEILESEFFDTRQAFLSLCQGNHYQYDTLRRAKHSSMMVLYHLHNPTAPAFVTTCNICRLDIETGQGWRCEVCPEYDVCNACYQKDGGTDHPHKLTNHPSIADRDAQNKEARQQRVLQLRRMLDLLVHASQCRSAHCQYPNCRKVKGLFRHGMHCKTRASGGCVLCKKMWYLLQLHARACKESECHVPRCRDLKEHLRRLQQQSDSRRRAAVMEMMRQRAAEVANNSG
ncbi:histone acetyltransferase HAC1-like isoform X1 [Vigna umbellata]|uniref:histone acetyltransferase HAC1-like isoform X1 n=1 Tax=Vigna umbellata TaxID=87088 RepID=UPI001F5E562B|nr:histone acetyltransferase HAC1-like isoform X1 [Vigna umbellata]XP_047171127.1 histone acetyltransferase HAC1-like isoform X1 [Vigna umbellata]XP_047171128.1 histone acetyltransferase HAC1-like isoform X1 [Vigna umbellata]XP_047171129.1 histone acetyltransferase HAC1-like isoform X1 [Vigna umbellata]XP_047171130.1 histone acetyltransferase HAC1-like isoform X1 [Vigna umbellata]